MGEMITDYLLVILSCFLLSCSMMTTKQFQSQSDGSFGSAMRMNIAIGIAAAITAITASGFAAEMNMTGFIYGSLSAVFVIIYTVCGYFMMSSGNVSEYTFALMSGRLILPFIYGIIFLNEEMTFKKVVAASIILLSLLLFETSTGKITVSTVLLFFGVFFGGGINGILCKLHQISEDAVPSFSFTAINHIIKLIICAVLLFAFSKKSKIPKKEKKSYPIVLLGAVFLTFSLFLQLEGAKTLDSSVIYPIISGGTAVISVIMGAIFFKEKITPQKISATLLCLCGTVIFAFQ